MKDSCESRYFLGIEFARSKNEILINQRSYALELISKYGLTGGKIATTLLEKNKKLMSLKYDYLFNIINNVELKERRVYQRLIGRLLNLSMTKINILFFV